MSSFSASIFSRSLPCLIYVPLSTFLSFPPRSNIPLSLSSLSLHLPSLPLSPSLSLLPLPSIPLLPFNPIPPLIPLPAVMRMAGSRRLLLNSNMWTEMSCEKVNAKSIRFTGQDIDSGSIRIFLIKVTVFTAKGGGGVCEVWGCL